MQIGVKKRAKIDQNMDRHKIVKMAHFSPLYANRVKIYDTNCPKLTDIFPLYAKRGQKHDKNCPYLCVDHFVKFDPDFPLICEMAEKT